MYHNMIWLAIFTECLKWYIQVQPYRCNWWNRIECQCFSQRCITHRNSQTTCISTIGDSLALSSTFPIKMILRHHNCFKLQDSKHKISVKIHQKNQVLKVLYLYCCRISPKKFSLEFCLYFQCKKNIFHPGEVYNTTFRQTAIKNAMEPNKCNDPIPLLNILHLKVRYRSQRIVAASYRITGESFQFSKVKYVPRSR